MKLSREMIAKVEALATVAALSPAVVRKRARMNKTEQRYQDHLRIRMAAGEVASIHFESIKLRLADKTWYTPDFFVVLVSGRCEVHEVKGFWRDDARVKWKVAAELYPMFAFVAVTRRNGGWCEEYYR